MPTAGPERDTPILDELRARIARLEADTVCAAETSHASGCPGDSSGAVPLGHTALDAMLGGGLARGALHEIRASEADGALAFGFATALTARLTARLAADATDLTGLRTRAGVTGSRWTLLITTFDGVGEWGGLYGPGLAAFGLDPGRVLIVQARRPREALWAAEEGLSSRALAAVLTEIRGDPAAVNLTATRRLVLRAARSGVTAMLVRPGAGAGLSAARTRWRIAPPAAPRAGDVSGLPPPAWQADLERNAARPGGRFSLMWKSDEHVFAPVDPASLPVSLPGTPGIAAGYGPAGSGTAGTGTSRSGIDGPGPALPRPAAAAPAGRAADAGSLPGGSVERPAVVPLRRTG